MAEPPQASQGSQASQEQSRDEEEQRLLVAEALPVSSSAAKTWDQAYEVSRKTTQTLASVWADIRKGVHTLLTQTPLKDTPYAADAVIGGTCILLLLIFLLLLSPGAAPPACLPPAALLESSGVSFNQMGGWGGFDEYLLRATSSFYDEAMQTAGEYQMVAAGPFAFSRFSSYRMDASSFAAVGLGSVYLKEHFKLAGCEWVESNGTKLWGSAHIVYTETANGAEYDTVIIKCSFGSKTGHNGGALTAWTDSKGPLPLFRETPLPKDEPRIIDPPIDSVLDHVVTMCTHACPHEVEARLIYEYVSYHLHLGISHFRLYDNGWVDQTVGLVLNEFLSNGTVEFIPFREVMRLAPSAPCGWHLGLHDCLYSSRFTSKWVLLATFDLYMFISPPSDFFTLLARYSDLAWITVGAQSWSVPECREGNPFLDTDDWYPERASHAFAIEWMVYRQATPYCNDGGQDPQRCVGDAGKRALFLNPRKVEVSDIFYVKTPGDQSSGENLHFDEIHNNYYGSVYLKSMNETVCSKRRGKDEFGDSVRDEIPANVSKTLRTTPLPSTEEAFKPHE